MARWILIACVLAASPVRAQLHLPSVQMPQLPLGIPSSIDSDRSLALRQRLSGLDRLDLPGVRLGKNRELLRLHGGKVEADPNGDLVVRNEIVAYMLSPEMIDKARAVGFTIIREHTLTGLDASTVVLRPQRGVSTADGLRSLREIAPDGVFDFNHLYSDSGQGAATNASRAPIDAQAANSRASLPAESGRKVGLIDGGIDADAAALRKAHIHRDGCNGRTVASAHGTAVASILVGEGKRFRGAAPGAELYAVDVYCGDPAGGSVDAIVDAFAWMANRHVAVVNISLVGPPNRILEHIVGGMIARGHLIVAAVGNDGPAAAPLYPASYPGVIGVTAVDAAQHVLPEAGRGPQVTFAAPGADMMASTPNGYTSVRGTSFAAPVVAGLLASLIDEPDRARAQQALMQLVGTVTDLGPPGKDPVYGYGFVGEQVRVAQSRIP